MAKLITQAEYARRNKITRQYVRKLVGSGRIELKRGGLFDPAQANAARVPQRVYAGRATQKGSNAHGGGRPRREPAAEDQGAGQAPARPSATASLTAARAAEASMGAQLRHLDLQERRGQLMPVSDVLAGLRRQNANFKARLRAVARAKAPVLAKSNSIPDCERILLDEFEALLNDLHVDPLGLIGQVAPPAAPEPAEAPAVQTPAGVTA